jgi:hypothetical protein
LLLLFYIVSHRQGCSALSSLKILLIFSAELLHFYCIYKIIFRINCSDSFDVVHKFGIGLFIFYMIYVSLVLVGKEASPSNFVRSSLYKCTVCRF